MIREDGLLKYPRTPHLEGSRLQPGDTDADQTSLASLGGDHAVIEEKLDGANCGVSFSDQKQLQLQSRGHFLTGGAREKHFNLLKQWAGAHEKDFFEILGTRYIMFGEWMFAKHSMYYDALPHLFIEFDIFDKEQDCFLSTPRRHELLDLLPVVSVPVVYSGPMPSTREQMARWIGPSVARSQTWEDSLESEVAKRGLDLARVKDQTDPDHQSEGLYIKIEDENKVLGRFKFVRASFTQTILDQDEHWQKRPVVPNGLRPGVDLFSLTVDKSWPKFTPQTQNSRRHSLP